MPAYTELMWKWFARGFAILAFMLPTMIAGAQTPTVDYEALWEKATPFDRFLNGVRAREAQWKSRFADAAVDADALTRMRALKERRRLLVVAEDRCSDSAWAVPYIAKLAAAVPERLELRVISRRDAPGIQEAYQTPDGRRATPTVVILDQRNAPLAAWVERPAELQQWYINNKPSMATEELHAHMDKWYATDAGRSTIREIITLLER